MKKQFKKKKEEKKKDEIENNFSDYLFKKFKEEIHPIKEYESDDDSDDEEEEEKKKELKEIFDLIKKHFEGNFTMKQYKFFEKEFNKYKNKIKKKLIIFFLIIY